MRSKLFFIGLICLFFSSNTIFGQENESSVNVVAFGIGKDEGEAIYHAKISALEQIFNSYISSAYHKFRLVFVGLAFAKLLNFVQLLAFHCLINPYFTAIRTMA